MFRFKLLAGSFVHNNADGEEEEFLQGDGKIIVVCDEGGAECGDARVLLG